MPVKARRSIDEIGRIGNDEITAVVNSVERVAQHGCDVGNLIEQCIDAAVTQRLGVDVGQDHIHLRSSAHEVGGIQPSRAAAAADIDDREALGGRDAGDGRLQRTREAIGIGSEENAVCRISGKRRVHE